MKQLRILRLIVAGSADIEYYLSVVGFTAYGITRLYGIFSDMASSIFERIALFSGLAP